MLRRFFASRHPLSFDIARVAQWGEGSKAVYGVPEPEESLRSTMRALWELFPEFPPYGGADDPPPHASLTLVGDDETLTQVESRLDGILPVHFDVDEAVLMEEAEPDVWRVRERFPFGSIPAQSARGRSVTPHPSFTIWGKVVQGAQR